MPSVLKPRLGSRSFSPRAYWREVVAVLMLLFAIVFFRSERKELQAIQSGLQRASVLWMFAGLAVAAVYIFFQSGIYKKSFAAIGLNLHWLPAIVLFLKRNFIAVFLPAGSISSLAYSPPQIRRLGFNPSQVHQASGLFGFTGLLSVFIVGIPVFIYTLAATGLFQNAWPALLVLLCFIVMVVVAVRSIKQKKGLYQWIDKRFPSLIPRLNELFAADIDIRKFSSGVLFSVGVELCGIIHVYIAMMALNLHASISASAAAYIIAVLMMIVSPFLKGLGAVELSMVYVLEQFGYTSTEALSITVLYRVFEFWLPLLTGLASFMWKAQQLFFRAAPVVFTFVLGFVNIISVVRPPGKQRLILLREYLPLNAIHASNLLVLFVGVGLLITSAFLLKGLRNAWIAAILFSCLSLVGHLTKALDYEEALMAATTLVVLSATSRQYRLRSSIKWLKAGLKTSTIGFAAALLFGITSFYFVDAKHFGVSFTWQQSLLHTLKSFLLIEDVSLHPLTRFGHELIWIIRITGFINWGFLFFNLTAPQLRKRTINENAREKAKFLLEEFGNSAVDYFKVYRDKLIFLSDVHDAFIAYRIALGFAIVLEEPVCEEGNKLEVLQEFERHCRKMGLKTAFYRVDESSVHLFNQLRKQKLMIGQEALLDIHQFMLEGRDRKSLRNSLNSLHKKGFCATIHTAPHDEAFLSQLRKVSDEWLRSFHKKEVVFSQGMFDENELKHQDVITVANAEGVVKAFLNIIPDYAEDECTYDLIRKTDDAPGGVMDVLIIQLIEYGRKHNKSYLNLGLVPMTGIVPDTTAEHIIKLAAEKIKRFQHYKGLREFKEKYATLWENKYLIYDNDFDLLQLPLALNSVMKP